jgi:hypothetical protein
MKRINGIGTVDGTAITLTHKVTKACGHLLPEGVDGGDLAREGRAAVHKAAQKAADAIGKPVEIYGSTRGAQDWVIAVVAPS